jgi:3-oxoacyl-(acyl-carrier-protein) synthase
LANERDEIVITGMSINTPLGDTLGGFIDAMYEGKSALSNWHSIDASRIYSKVGADLGAYDLEAKLQSLEGRIPGDVWRRLRKLHVKLPWSTKITTTLAVDACADAGLFEHKLDPARIGVIVSGHNINVNYDFDNRTQFDHEPDYIDSLYGLQTLDTDHAAAVSEVLGIYGPVYTIGAACASGNVAVRNAIDELKHHGLETMIVVGPVFDWSPVMLHGMALLGAISFNGFVDSPQQASRPYDMRREGFVPAHGGGALVLEKRRAARSVGRAYYAQVLAAEATSSASHLPTPSAEWQAEAMRRALGAAALDPSRIDYVSAHATSTSQGDLSELQAIETVFGEHARDLHINAPKSLLGHTCWSAPVVELVAAVLQMQRGRIHRTINIDDLDPQVTLDVTANANRELEIRYLMKNSFGFGGINCVSILKAPEPGEGR